MNRPWKGRVVWRRKLSNSRNSPRCSDNLSAKSVRLENGRGTVEQLGCGCGCVSGDERNALGKKMVYIRVNRCQ